MLEFIDIGVPGVVAYRLEGKTTTEDMKTVLDRFRQIIDQGEKINLYQEITSLGGVELEALGEKLKFFLDVGLSNFGKVAVVANKKWIPKLIDIEGKLLPNVDMKGFSMEEKDAAVGFLKG